MRWVLELSPAPPRAFGNIPSAFVNGKNLPEILFLGTRVTTSYKSLFRSAERRAETQCIPSRCVITFSLAFPVFVCPFKGHSRDNAAKSSPRGSWVECLLRGAVTEGCVQIFAHFSFFCLLAHSKRRSKDQSLQIGCFPPKGDPTGLVSQLNLSQVVIRGDAEYEGENWQLSHTLLEKKRKEREKAAQQAHQTRESVRKADSASPCFQRCPFPACRQRSH